MKPELCEAIEAATELAWMPTANLPRSRVYWARSEAHDRLVAAVARLGPVPDADAELTYLLAAIRRAAAASYSNRMGEPYYERREAIYQLRGCLDVFARSLVDAPASVAMEAVA